MSAQEPCPACVSYFDHYPAMVGEWECSHTADEYAFMLALADAIHGPTPEGEFTVPGWRAAQFLDDAEVALSCGTAPYTVRFQHNIDDWTWMALVNDGHLIGMKNEENAELEYIANIGWLATV
jgi:hypothetical protein